MHTLSHTTKLLLVDDDPSMVRLLTRLIDRSFGNRMELHFLTDPKEARQWIEQNLIDILVTDLEMPGVNGLELLRCVKRKNPCAQVLFVTGHSTLEALTDALELVRVILSSGYSEEDATELLAGQELAGFIQKPYDLETMIARLREVLGDGRAPDRLA